MNIKRKERRDWNKLKRNDNKPPSIFRRLSSPFRMEPDFLILGTQKGGTTSLYRLLIQHPDILPAYSKELRFFSDENLFNQGINYYKSYFPFKGENKITGESTPIYLLSIEVPSRVKRSYPDMKFIVLLRDPVERVYSQYRMHQRLGNEELPLEEAIHQEKPHYYLVRGHYADQLENWLKYFDREQFLIIKSEWYFQNQRKAMKIVYDFLDLEFVPQRKLYMRFNKRKSNYDSMKPRLRQELVEYYKPHNQKLYELLGKDFQWNPS